MDQILEQAKNNISRARTNSALPQGDKWAAGLAKMRRDIAKMNSVTEAIEYAQVFGKLDFDHREAMSVDKAVLYEESINEEFPHFSEHMRAISDSPASCKGTYIEYNNRLVSNVLYFHYRYVLRCLTHIKEPKVICEIGSGYGAPARLWMINTIYNPQVYILLDFAECLFFAESFLKASFKERDDIAIVHINDISDLSTLNFSQKTMILCPIGQEQMLSHLPIDLVINTGSMQEMTDEWINHWMKWLDESNVRYFYSLNYVALPLIKRGPECATFYAPRLSPRWSCIERKAIRPCAKAGPICIFGEIVAEKNDPVINKELLRAQLYKALEKPLNEQTFFDCLEVIRLLPEQELIGALMVTVVDKMSFIPQETLFLAGLLKRIASAEFLAKNKKKIAYIDYYLHYKRACVQATPMAKFFLRLQKFGKQLLLQELNSR